MHPMNENSGFMILGFMFFIAKFLSIAYAEFHYYDFVLEEKNFTRMCGTKNMLVVNGSFPGPEIRVRKEDTVYVTVHNQGSYGVTIHWHGVKQPRNPWSDGPAYITQCPIEAGTNFTYEIIFSDEVGTLWWHAHSLWTRESVHGAIVILPELGTTQPFPEPDGEEVIILAAWYEGDLMDLVLGDLENGTDLPNSDAYCINGLTGDFNDPCSINSSYTMLVEYGKTYLMRIINAVMNEEMFFAIANHNLTVVGMDGAYTKPFTSSFVLLTPGQTMNVLFTSNQTVEKYYYMAARQYDSDDSPTEYLTTFNVTGIVEYRDIEMMSESPVFPSMLPAIKDVEAAINFTNKIKSLASDEYPVNVPRIISTRMYVTVSMNYAICPSCSTTLVSGTKLSSSFNNVSWVDASIDILSAYYSNTSGYYTTDFPDWPESFYNFTGDDMPDNTSMASEGTRVKVLNYNETVEIVFQDTNAIYGAMNHPMHMHGYSFYVVGLGYGNFNNETDPNAFNLIDPPQVNTFTVPSKGWLAVRFIANNPGVWLWHCHFDKHLSWGMDTVFIVKNGDTPGTSLRRPPTSMPSCGNSKGSSIQNI